mmetsp:Transcript_34571/g.45695  ORF Transcript_34571/g.45695 Transcript_34571/m.45695 type:complete len:100 (-) Transcript_34571:323-622(-)
MHRTLLKLNQSSSVKEAARKIFGNLPLSSVKTGLRIFRKPLAGPRLADYYPPSLAKCVRTNFPDYLTPQQIRTKERIERLRKRGKGPPKKGEGKRSSKK